MKPISARLKNGVLELRNHFAFLHALDYVRVRLSALYNGHTYHACELPFKAAPAQSDFVPLDFDIRTDGLSVVNLSYELKKALPLLPEGHELGFDQFVLSDAAEFFDSPVPPSKDKLTLDESARALLIQNSRVRYRFNKQLGVFDELSLDGCRLNTEPLDFNLYRAPCDNDRKILLEWKNAGYDRKRNQVRHLRYALSDEALRLDLELVLGAISLRNIVEMELRIWVFNNGELRYELKAHKNKELPFLPRFGLRLALNQSFEAVEYLGYGPHESYVDKHHACRLGYFKDSASAMFNDYIKPQENGSRYDCRLAYIKGATHQLKIKGRFSLNVLHYSIEQLSQSPHNYDLREEQQTCVCLDYFHSGLGSNSCGPTLDPRYRLDQEQFEFSLDLAFIKN